MKLCVWVLFQLLPWLAWIGDWALKWTEGNEALQITFSMLVFPLIMNALQYWIIDSFIKDPAGGSGGAWDGHEQIPQDEDEDHRQGRREPNNEEEEHDNLEEEDVKRVTRTLKEANPTPAPAYTEEEAGGASSGSSARHSRGASADERKA